MITVKLFSYDNKKDDIVWSVFDICDEAINDVSIIEKMLRASVMPFHLMSHTIKKDGDYDLETIVLSIPSYLCSKIDDIAKYLRLGLRLALALDND